MASLALPALIAGCAQEKTASTGEQAQEYLDLVMSTKYPEFHPDQWGIYIIEDTPGTGAAWTKDLKYSSLRSTLRSLDGTILSSTEADIAQQLDENDYKPKWTHVTTTNEEDYYPGNETQFRNNMVYENGTGSTDSDKPKDAETNSMTFDLPTGWYYVNFYPNAATPYYTIEHSMELRDFNEVYYRAAGTAEQRNVIGRNDYNFLRVWSDHIAWNKTDKAQRQLYTCQDWRYTWLQAQQGQPDLRPGI